MVDTLTVRNESTKDHGGCGYPVGTPERYAGFLMFFNARRHLLGSAYALTPEAPKWDPLPITVEFYTKQRGVGHLDSFWGTPRGFTLVTAPKTP